MAVLGIDVDVVDRIVGVKTGRNDRPVEDVVIERVTIEA